MERQPLVPGDRICMPKLFANCKGLSSREELFLAGDFFLLRDFAASSGTGFTSDFGGQFVGCCFSSQSFQLFVLLPNIC